MQRDQKDKDDDKKDKSLGGSTSSMFSKFTIDTKKANKKKEDDLAAATQAAIEAPAPILKYVDLTNTEVISPEISKPFFSYERISSIPILNENSRRSTIRGDGYISFSLQGLAKQLRVGESYRKHGLKIQISLDDEIDGNIKKGWDAIVGILAHYNLARVKVEEVGRKEKDKEHGSIHNGKQVVLYAYMHQDDSNWFNILTSISRSLQANGVAPGYRPDLRSSKSIQDNCYFSYRYDADPLTQEYRAPSTDGAFPEGVRDPLKGLSIPTPGLLPKTKALTTVHSSLASSAASPRGGDTGQSTNNSTKTPSPR